MRLAGQAKGGFYPTPPAVVERVARMIAPRERHGVSRLLDPCCGEGAALAQLGERLRLDSASVETYAIELHRERHEAARAVLDHTLCSDTFQVTMANAGFDLLWLNPPYDYDDELRRQEHKFLLQCTRYLALERTPLTPPSSVPDPVRSYTTQPITTCCIHWPTLEKSVPIQSQRKLEIRSAAAGPGASLVPATFPSSSRVRGV